MIMKKFSQETPEFGQTTDAALQMIAASDFL